MSRKFKITGAVSDYLKRFTRGEYTEQQPDSPDAAPEHPQDKKPAQEAEVSPVQDGKGFTVYALTDVGRVRSSNQDAILQGERIFGVADGMGGHKGGETASAGARDGMLTLLAEKSPDPDALLEAVQTVNSSLFHQQQTDENLHGMGTTLTALWLSEQDVYIAHVGDSRAYRLRKGKLTQITSDHSLVGELVRAGVLTPEQAANHPMRNVITRAVGTEDTIQVDVLREERKAGDLWLVCSDGLYGMVDDAAMESILKGSKPSVAVQQLMEAALAAGGHDNVTVVLLQDKEGRG
ncbi:MAG: Stp1/IreP family PP2C-type Ser/Thr phosphatase [Aristaeellaceae bacterium]